ncbi:translation initiation factor IF-2-like [Tyto alba]|uniref:translation initiation factor IF-2-like n=1 Tax=Tyto alba TaxID=56313 RepID=UPI001C67530D|nr:translation initiation factor IF-2-like [Tyto alba]
MNPQSLQRAIPAPGERMNQPPPARPCLLPPRSHRSPSASLRRHNWVSPSPPAAGGAGGATDDALAVRRYRCGPPRHAGSGKASRGVSLPLRPCERGGDPPLLEPGSERPREGSRGGGGVSRCMFQQVTALGVWFSSPSAAKRRPQPGRQGAGVPALNLGTPRLAWAAIARAAKFEAPSAPRRLPSPNPGEGSVPSSSSSSSSVAGRDWLLGDRYGSRARNAVSRHGGGTATLPRGVVLGRPQKNAAGAGAGHHLCLPRGLRGRQPHNKPGRPVLHAHGGWTCRRTQAGKQQVCRGNSTPPPAPRTPRPSCGSVSGSRPGCSQCKGRERGANTRPVLV